MLNGIVQSIFEGYKAAKQESYYDIKFRDLNKTWNCWIGEATTPLLEVSELNDLLNHAETKQQHEAILDHLYRHDATRVGYYRDIEKKIIDCYWEG